VTVRPAMEVTDAYIGVRSMGDTVLWKLPYQLGLMRPRSDQAGEGRRGLLFATLPEYIGGPVSTSWFTGGAQG